MARNRGPAVEVEGLRELQRAIRMAADRDLKKQMRKANKDAAEVVKDKVETPKRSGRLQKSVGVRASNSSAKVKAGSPSRAPHAGPIHFGWPARGIKPRRFLNRALWETREKVRDTYDDALDAIRKRLSSRRL